MNELHLIKKIYDKMADEVSKKIFIRRLQYSITSDLLYIDKLVDSEMLRYGENDILNLLLEWLNAKANEVVLFGAGVAGEHIMHALSRRGIKISYIADNNKDLWGEYKNNVKIISPDNIDENANIIIGVNKCAEEIYRQLCDMGHLKDNIFLANKCWWLGGERQYFDSEIVVPSKSEVFVDGGALDGEDTIKFFEWCVGSNAKVYLFEPASCNKRNLKKLAKNDDRIEYIDKGLWCENVELRFDTRMACSGKISNMGDASIEVTSLDEVMEGREVSFIKMDIEGSEIQALLGSEETIKKYKPRLAICVYHRVEDILEIPKLILQMNPEYKLYLRHYSYVDTETVLYAI